MTTTYQRLEADIAQARKARDADRLKVLTLLASKVQRVAKDDGNRAATDVDLVTGVSRYRKEVEDMREAKTRAGRDTAAEDAELAIVTGYLPQQMTQDELDAEIERALAGTDRTMKAMGAVMRHLNEGFRGRFDPKAANARIKALIG